MGVCAMGGWAEEFWGCEHGWMEGKSLESLKIQPLINSANNSFLNSGKGYPGGV